MPLSFSGLGGLPITVVTLLLLAVWSSLITAQRSKIRCKVKCGVISESGDEMQRAALGLVQTAWSELRFRKGITDIEMQFVPIKKRTEITMDILIEAYMEIGTTNISALIGPSFTPLVTATEKFGIPYFVIGHVDNIMHRPFNILSVFPNPRDVVAVAVEVAKNYGWSEVAVIYDSIEGLYLIEQLVLAPELHVRSWKINNSENSTAIRDKLIQIRTLSLRHVILLTDRLQAINVLQKALHLSMLSSYWTWILPNLMLEMNDLKPYMYTSVNFTTFKLVQEDWNPVSSSAGQQYEFSTTYDSLLTLYHSIKIYHRNSHRCHWTGQQQIYHILPKISDRGATGQISFQDNGRRFGYTVDILGLRNSGLHKVGMWNSSEHDAHQRLQMNYSQTTEDEKLRNPFGVKTIRVAALQERPFLQLRYNGAQLKGNDRFEGFTVDLLKAMAELLNFQFELYIIEEGGAGAQKPDGLWNGLIGDLLNGNASIGVSSMTMTTEREQLIDFTKPYKTTGISIAMKRNHPRKTYFQFIRPFSGIVWLLLLGVVVLVSITLYIIDKVTPGDGADHYSEQDAVWFTISSLILRTANDAPKNLSGRILAGALWYFSLILITSYTANLAAYLTVSRLVLPVQSIADLLRQSRIIYGTVRNSYVSTFFQDSHLDFLHHMWNIMSKADAVTMVNTSEEGFDRVRNSDGDYAFIWDSTIIKHHVSLYCDIVEVGQPLYTKGYSFAVPQGASYTDNLSVAISKLRENGQIERLEKRWWPINHCPYVDDVTTDGDALSVDATAGLFMMLASGVVVALISSIVEYACRKRRRFQQKNRKLPEASLSSKPLCEGHTISRQLQLEEPFLPQMHSSTPSKQTNIF